MNTANYNNNNNHDDRLNEKEKQIESGRERGRG